MTLFESRSAITIRIVELFDRVGGSSTIRSIDTSDQILVFKLGL
jgi:hypothetical protein